MTVGASATAAMRADSELLGTCTDLPLSRTAWPEAEDSVMVG